MKRTPFALLAGLLAAAVALSACSSSPGGGASGGAGGGTIASKFIFGGPPEWASRHQAELAATYGVTFEKITQLDTGGPNTVTALRNGQVDAADLFTSDPAIKANNFIVLSDPKSLFGAQNVVPLITKSKATAGVTAVLNNVDAAISDSVLIDLNTKVEVDKQDPVAVATTWLNTLGHPLSANLNDGISITVGSANFPENVELADIYAAALAATGVHVTKKLNIGAREKYFPALQDGSINLIPEYLGSILTYLDSSATAATITDVQAALATKLPSNLTTLTPAPAQDNDSIVVTKATADKYLLSTIADLAKPAP
jgi:osmoprotectant transport system substrate-binding protein